MDIGFPVLCLLSVKNYLWVGTSDSIRILGTTKDNSFKLVDTLRTQTRAIKDMIACYNVRGGGGGGASCEGYCANSKEKEKENEKEEQSPQPQQQEGEIRVWTASDDNTICVWRLNENPTGDAAMMKMLKRKKNRGPATKRHGNARKNRGSILILGPRDQDEEHMFAKGGSTSGLVTHLATLKGHGGRVLCLLQLAEKGQVWSAGSFDNLIVLWDQRTMQYIGELGKEHHKDIVRALVKIDSNCVWSGSLDPLHAITIWKGCSENNTNA